MDTFIYLYKGVAQEKERKEEKKIYNRLLLLSCVFCYTFVVKAKAIFFDLTYIAHIYNNNNNNKSCRHPNL